MSRPTIVVEVAFTTSNPLTIPASWTDISSYVLDDGLSIRRGRTDELKAFPAATASLRLDNSDRRFEPLNGGSPYSPNVVPMRRIRIRAKWDSITYTIFAGFITDWRPDYTSGALTVTVQCIDFIGAYLARTSLSSVNIFSDTWRLYASTPDATLAYSPDYPLNGRAVRVRVGHDGSYGGTLNSAMTINGTNAVTGLSDSEVVNFTVTGASTYANPVTATSTKRWLSISSIVRGSATSSALRSASPTLTIDPSPTYPSEFSGDAIVTLLNGAGIASGDRDIGNGASLIQAYAYGGSTLNSLIQSIVTSEDGTYYTDRNGLIEFRGRNFRLNPSTPSITFDTASGSLYPYTGATLSYNDQNVYNYIRVSRTGGITQEERDVTSIGAYFERVLERSTLLTTDSEADSLAQWLLGFYKDPGLRVSSLRHNGELAPSTLWPVLLAADVNDRYRVIVRPRTGSAITRDVWLEGINITVNRGAWAIEWSLTPGDSALYGFWELDTSQLDTNTKLSY